MPPPYDAFISYKSEYKAWVEALARNLERQGLQVWFDDWRKVAGDPVGRTLQDAIREARAGILVATPEAAESGWVQNEYEAMLAEENRRQEGSPFRVVPLLLRDGGDFPFLHTRFFVDFRDPALYRRKLFELVQGVRGEPAPPDGEHGLDFAPPPPLPDAPATVTEKRARSIFDGMFDDLNHWGIVALFVQEAMGYGASDGLVRQARERYGNDRVIHLVPRIATEAEAAHYFADLARQAGLDPAANDAGRLLEAMHGLVRKSQTLVLVLSQFENGPPQARRDFAHVLRTLRAEHADEVRILIRGGEELARLRYEDGTFSLLNTAYPAYWPELTPSDVIGLWTQRATDGALPDPVARAILDFTGGEPRMVAHCLQRLSAIEAPGRPPDPAALAAIAGDLLADCDLCLALFVPLRRETASLPRLCTWLGRPELRPFTGAWLDDPLQRRLFWRNALCVRQDGARKVLAWRSDHLRRLGREILACDAS